MTADGRGTSEGPEVGADGRIADARGEDESARSFRVLADSLRAIVWMISPDWRVVEYVNPAFERVYGISARDLYARPSLWIDAMHPEDRERVLGEIEAQRGRPMELEYRIVRPDGGIRWIRDVTSPVKDEQGKTILLAGHADDVTEQHRAAEELRASRALLDTVIESLPFDVFVLARDGRYMLQNTACRNHWGDAVGVAPETTAPDEATLELWHDNNRRGFAGEVVDEEVSFPVGGELRHVRNIISPIRRGDDVPAIVGINIDITDRTRAEQELARSLREKELLLREIQHRIKNNLQIVAGLLDLNADAFPATEQRAVFRDLTARVKSMALVHDMLSWSDDGGRVDLQRLVPALVRAQLDADPEASDIEMVVRADPVVVPADVAIPSGLVVCELVSNALKHAFPAGFRTGADRPRPRVQVDVARSERLRLTIADNGVGLPFDLDWHDSPSLGLQLVDSLLKQLGATATVHRGDGTSITVEISC